MKTSEQNPSTSPCHYYRSIRYGDQVHRKYVGTLSDPLVELLFRKKQLLQATHQAHHITADEEATRYASIEHCLEQYRRQFKLLLTSWREHRGYRECEDGMWRLRQRRKRKPIMKYADLQLMIRQAEDGDEEALRQLQVTIQGNRNLWRPFGDLSQYVIRQLLQVTVGKNVVARESLSQRMEEMKDELLGESASPVRKLVVEQALITWLDAHYQVLLASQPGLSGTARNCLEARVQRARKRHADALETVARVTQVEEGGEFAG